MLLTLGIWVYVVLVSFVWGNGFLFLLERKLHWKSRRIDVCMITGLVLETVYAQFFSLFYKVGLIANIILILSCIVLLLLLRERYKDILWEFRKNTTRYQWLIWGLLFFFFAYGVSRGEIHYDTGLYHAQSVRWLEEYGIVKGLGNLHNRLAYNSAAFSLTALFSMSFFGGQSFHVMAGFLGWILACVSAELVEIRKRKRVCVSDFVAVLIVYYLTTIFNQMISPESDYFMNLIVLYIVYRWIKLLEQKEEQVAPYALLCVLGVYAVTLKLSGAMILVLVLQPAVWLLRKKDWKGIALYLSLGVITVLPYLIRNVVLSGWLVYPFPAVDLFSFDWKIPEGVAGYDAAEIKVWGRGLYDVALQNMPLMQWAPKWFASLSGLNRVFFLGSVAAIFWTLLQVISQCIRKQKGRWEYLLVQFTCVCCFLFWFINAPLIRYGFIFLGLTVVVSLGNAYVWGAERLESRLTGKRMTSGGAYGIFILGLAVFFVAKAASMGKQMAQDYENAYWICQKDYESFPCTTFVVKGTAAEIEVFYPTEGDRTGYEPFPATDHKRELELRGETIKEGFRAVN